MLFFYENNSLKSGIYEIRNRLSNKSYIGQTKRFKKRWASDWKHQLIKNKCRNKHLQNSFNFYFEQVGHTNFLEFHILEIMSNSTQTERETSEENWIKEYKENGYKLYNEKEKTVSTGRSCKSLTPEETKEKHSKKMSVIMKEKYKNDKEFIETMKAGSIKRGKKSRKYFDVKFISPTNEVFGPIGYELIDFCKKHNLSYSGMLGVANKKTMSSKGWILEENKGYVYKQGNFTTKTRHFKSYNISLVSSTNEIYSNITNLSEFMKQHNLGHEMYAVARGGRFKSHKGWRLLENINWDFDKEKQMLAKKARDGIKNRTHRIKTYNIELLSPKNEIVKLIDNMNKFSIEHNLNCSKINAVIKGRIKSHRGWRLANPTKQ